MMDWTAAGMEPDALGAVVESVCSISASREPHAHVKIGGDPAWHCTALGDEVTWDDIVPPATATTGQQAGRPGLPMTRPPHGDVPEPDDGGPTTVHENTDGTWTVRFDIADDDHFADERALLWATLWLARHREHSLCELRYQFQPEDPGNDMDLDVAPGGTWARVELRVSPAVNEPHFPPLRNFVLAYTHALSGLLVSAIDEP